MAGKFGNTQLQHTCTFNIKRCRSALNIKKRKKAVVLGCIIVLHQQQLAKSGCHFAKMVVIRSNFLENWVIPENIHTIPRAASWNSEGEGGFLGLEFRRRGGVTQFGIPKAWGGVSALNSVNFQRKDGESSA